MKLSSKPKLSRFFQCGSACCPNLFCLWPGLVIRLWESHARSNIQAQQRMVLDQVSSKLWHGRATHDVWASAMMLLEPNMWDQGAVIWGFSVRCWKQMTSGILLCAQCVPCTAIWHRVWSPFVAWNQLRAGGFRNAESWLVSTQLGHGTGECGNLMYRTFKNRQLELVQWTLCINGAIAMKKVFSTNSVIIKSDGRSALAVQLWQCAWVTRATEWPCVLLVEVWVLSIHVENDSGCWHSQWDMISTGIVCTGRLRTDSWS